MKSSELNLDWRKPLRIASDLEELSFKKMQDEFAFLKGVALQLFEY